MNAMLRRVFETAECKTQAELADFLGIRQSSVSDAKKRQVIPAEWLVVLVRLKSTHPDWILTGIGPRFIAPAEAAPGKHEALEKSNEASCTLENFSLRELAEELLRRVSRRS